MACPLRIPRTHSRIEEPCDNTSTPQSMPPGQTLPSWNLLVMVAGLSTSSTQIQFSTLRALGRQTLNDTFRRANLLERPYCSKTSLLASLACPKSFTMALIYADLLLPSHLSGQKQSRSWNHW